MFSTKTRLSFTGRRRWVEGDIYSDAAQDAGRAKKKAQDRTTLVFRMIFID
jgi:hypothetical protein